MLIRRPHYEQLIMRFFKTPSLIKVLTGIRRCGKSSLLRLVAQEASRCGIPANNIMILKMDNLDGDLGNALGSAPFYPTAEWLAERIDAMLAQADPRHLSYLFLDEIQDVPGWERVVRRLQAKGDIDIYLTGSNAYMLSSELSTLLSGRYVEITVNPLSYGEYLGFMHHYGIGIGSAREPFDGYLMFGGMPGQFDLRERNHETMTRLLQGVFDSVLLNDVAKRTHVSDIDLLEKLVTYLFSSSGNLFSTKKIVDTLTSSGRKTAQRTIDGYLEALKNALIVREVPQSGVKGKELLNPKRKFYPTDLGLRNLAAGFPTGDIGFQLENVVCNELVKRQFDVSVGSLPDGSEIDFVARRSTGEQHYYQVTQSLLDEGVYERELAPLRKIGDSFPKTVLTLDGFRTGFTEDGIRIVGLIDWLLETLQEDAGEADGMRCV